MFLKIVFSFFPFLDFDAKLIGSFFPFLYHFSFLAKLPTTTTTKKSMEESKHGDGPIGLWQDPDFPPSKESIGDLNEEEVPDIIWLRPSQFSSKYANKDRPFVLFDFSS